MTFADLKPGRVRAYVDALKGGDLWVFQHIPKTAGSSLAAELAANRPPYRNIHITFGDPGKAPEEQRNAAVEHFVAEAQGKGIRSASGHLRHRNIEAIRAAFPETRLFTFVREPVSRVISEYNYCRSPEHTNPEGFARAFPTLADFAASVESSNKMAMYITGQRNTKPEDLVAYAFERFAFIGSQKIYTLSFRLLSTLLWYETEQQAKLRVSGAKDPRTGIPPETLKLIRQANRADQALFNAVSEVYRSCRDEILTELRRRAKERQAV
jgi:hypothetical protein